MPKSRGQKHHIADLKGKLPHELAEDDPELMRLWGEINNAWDRIERLLYVAFDSMLSGETAFATKAVFYSQTSHAARRTMVESLAKYALINRPKTAAKLKRAIVRVKARSDERNRLAHGDWAATMQSTSGEFDLTRIAQSPSLIQNPNDSFSRSRLKEIRNGMRETAEALRKAIEPIDAEKRAKSGELRKRHLEKMIPLE